jgi:hypothetical protein
MESNIDSEKQWEEYKNTIWSTMEPAQNDNEDNPARLFRVNPKFQHPLPALDDVHMLRELRLRSQEFLEEKETKELIARIARQLIASSFYLQRGPISDQHGDKYVVKGKNLAPSTSPDSFNLVVVPMDSHLRAIRWLISSVGNRYLNRADLLQTSA